MIKKTDKRDIYYLDNTFLFHNITLSSGTGGCYLTPLDKNKNLSISYKIFNGVIKYLNSNRQCNSVEFIVS